MYKLAHKILTDLTKAFTIVCNAVTQPTEPEQADASSSSAEEKREIGTEIVTGPGKRRPISRLCESHVAEFHFLFCAGR